MAFAGLFRERNGSASHFELTDSTEDTTMRATNRPGWALILTAAAALPAAARAQAPANPPSTTIGSHQIDRFQAIAQLQADLRSDPNSLANWVILGELAHEVAGDLPQGQDDAYYKLSRESYERAVQLDPNNNGLKAAVQFARDQEANAAAFDAQRSRGVATYLAARRSEIAANGANPTVQVYESPAPSQAITYAPQSGVVQQPAQVQPGQVQPAYAQSAYPQPTYRPYYNAQQAQPLQYNQYSNGYVPPANSNQAAPPTTLRQFGQQLPGLLLNEVKRPGAPR